ncbi:hypothetical protein TIFTF001_008922 [Ficus carica]|uniref:Uncharacterized protein n=1 Tax=Ficus carica TaxID=3494 RepID=A0AA88CYH6_FICCA|nr:hypothetical protein TIFTF001_008922 [Ficus carica]
MTDLTGMVLLTGMVFDHHTKVSASAVDGFPDRHDRSRSGRSRKPASVSVPAGFPDRDQSYWSGKPTIALALVGFLDRPDREPVRSV